MASSAYDALGYERASIDFCERNFEHSGWVAEPVNALSSLPLVVLGLYGVFGATGARRAPARTPAWEDRAFALAYGILAAVGVGSAALHATLTRVGQFCDEAPMLLLNLLFLFLLGELEAEHARPARARAFAALGVATVALYVRRSFVF